MEKGNDLFANSNISLREAAVFFLEFGRTFHLSRRATNVLMAYVSSRLLPFGNCIPPTYKLLHGAAQSRTSTMLEMHCCMAKNCVGYRWDYLAKKDWPTRKDDTCPHCQQSRFVDVQKGELIKPPRAALHGAMPILCPRLEYTTM